MAEESARKKLVVIDGKSVFYRGYYAMPNLSTKDGKPTGGVFGFATMALEVIKRLKPDYVAVAWDKPKTNIRKRLEIYPQYKAGRKPPPPDFYEQIPILHELLDAFGWPLYELDDYEADDIMGALAVQARAADLDTLLVTSDMDMLQLVNGHVKVYALKTGLSNIELYSPQTFEDKHGIRVDQFLDLKSLKGDSSDNIPGVPGIGEKGAIELLHAYDNLDNIYDNLALIKDSLRKKLEAGKDLAYISKELARIWIDAPVPLDLEALDVRKNNPAKIAQLLQDLEFRSLLKRLPEVMNVPIEVRSEQLARGEGYLDVPGDVVHHITTGEDLKKLKLPEAAIINSRASGAHGRNPKYLIIASKNLSAIYTLDLQKLDREALLPVLSTIKSVIGYDVKNTLQLLIELGLQTLPVVEHDVLIAAFLLNSLRREQTLTDLAEADLDYDGTSLESLTDEDYLMTAPTISALISRLEMKQTKTLADNFKLASLARIVEWPLIPILARMEYVGIELDTQYLINFADEINDMISDYEQQIYGLADQEFNIASPSQLADILFEKLKLPTQGVKKGKTGYSTAARELDKLRGKHPIIDLITQYREVAKLKNTYVDTLPLMVDEKSRVHTNFNLTIAQTGRLSSTDPNLQNIPTKTDLGRRIRTAFVAGDGNKFVSADYSQFELRLAAVLAGDTELVEMFNRGVDIHTATAAQVYGRELEDVTKQMRRAAKVINFGILYGMSAHGLMVASDMTWEQATDFIEKYKALRKPLFDYIERVKEQAKKDGYVETLLGRRRPTPDILSSNFVVRQAAERAAINMPIQGTEADLMKLAMIQVDKLMTEKYPQAVMLLQIHDSILIECPAGIAAEIAELLKSTMEKVYKLDVRLDVDVTIGDNWGEL